MSREQMKARHAHVGSTNRQERAQYRDDHSRLLAALDAVEALADAWTHRGEHLMEYAKVAPEEVRDSLIESGEEFTYRANLIRAAIRDALGEDA